ncbi:MAG TPA: hypothetical protein VFS76_18665 [Pyrinomonadaceae bacterium]|nr:hypothetical protein [Pyrinomonadaceae bacterium]
MSFGRIAILRVSKRLDCGVNEKRVTGIHTRPLQLGDQIGFRVMPVI